MNELTYFGAVLQSFFQCQQCGGCCKVCSHISLDKNDIQDLSNFLKISEHDVIKKYTHRSLLNTKELNHNGACCFYDSSSKRCMVYEARPRVCRSYPFMSPEQNMYRDAGYGFKLYSDCPGCSKTIDLAKKEGLFVDLGSEVAFNGPRIIGYLMDNPKLLPSVNEQIKLHEREELHHAKLKKRMTRVGYKNALKQIQKFRLGVAGYV